MERLELCFNRCCALWIHVICLWTLMLLLVLRYYIYLSLAVNAFNYTTERYNVYAQKIVFKCYLKNSVQEYATL